MSLFNKKETESQEMTTVKAVSPAKPAKASGDVISSIISNDMKVTGELSFKGKARIDGVVEGNVNGDHLVLSESGKVMGDLNLTTLICHGSVEGNVKAQQVTAHTTSSLRGNLVASSLTVEAGAQLNGEVSSSAQPQSQMQQKTTPSATVTAKVEPEKKDIPKN